MLTQKATFSRKQMIYDCFTFFNELELLEVRLHELAGVVDKFVLVEATQTHTNKPKPLYYQENRARFGSFHDQIIHIVVDDLPQAKNPWTPENFQRNCICRGLTQCRPDDWILISDVDEIPRAETVERVSREYKFPRGFWADLIARPLIRGFTAWSFSRGRVRRNHPFILKLQQSSHRHFVNCVTVNPPKMVQWYGTRMLYYRDLISPELARHSGYKVIEKGGWHFTCMGGVKRIQEKIKSFAHQEFNYEAFLDPNRIHEFMNQGKSLFDASEELKFVRVDDSFPSYMREHPEKFSTWIKPV
jgi:beta-1,4-mannosyl-glycoprotein beta-1,4-N-acetylglucosaminyltransferase